MRQLSCIVLLILLLSLCSVGYAESSFDALYSRGNQYFEAGDYASARDAYNTIVKQGGIDASVLYNLGNCYLKLNDIGNAILCYRRALYINPRDEDIRSNLELARSIVPEKIDAVRAGGITNGLLEIGQATGASIITIITAVLWIISTLLLILAFTSRRKRTRRKLYRGTVVAFMMFAVFAGLLVIMIIDQQWTDHAVAVGDPVIARNGPGEHFTEVFQQHPGYEMKIQRYQAGWVEVVLANGYTAWVPGETVEIVRLVS